MATFKDLYIDTIRPQLKEKLGYSSVMAVPKIQKITINMGVGEAVGDKKVLDNAVSDMQLIAGQKPIVTKAKKSIAGFKIEANLSQAPIATFHFSAPFLPHKICSFFIDKTLTKDASKKCAISITRFKASICL